MRNLDLALIGNGAIGLLVDPAGTIVWGCFPRFDSDATFCALLDDAAPGAERGIWSIDLVDRARTEQSYVANTAVLDDAPVRQDRQRRRDHRLRAAIRPVWPDLPSGRRSSGASSKHRRQPARSSCACGPPSTTARDRPAMTVGSGHIRYVTAGNDAAPHDGCVADRDPRGAAVLPGRRRDPASSDPTRPCRRARRRTRPALHRGDHRALARLGPAAGDSVRVAGCRDPRRDHVAA